MQDKPSIPLFDIPVDYIAGEVTGAVLDDQAPCRYDTENLSRHGLLTGFIVISHYMKYTMLFAILLCCVSLSGTVRASVGLLEQRLNMIADSKNARIGVAVIIDGKDTIVVGNEHCYPMASVYKLHQAMAVTAVLESRNTTLDTMIYIPKEWLAADTYSPLRDQYPDGSLSLPVRQLLSYTLLLSDNNACDILFRCFGGPQAVEQYVHGIGIHSCAIRTTEEQMYQDVSGCYHNCTTPLAAAILLEVLLTQPLFSEDNQVFLQQTLIACQTGKNRLARPLSATEAIIGHKTGTGPVDAQGEIMAVNDVGFVFMPDGRRYVMAVLIQDSMYDVETTENIIADLSQAVYDYMKCQQDKI